MMFGGENDFDEPGARRPTASWFIPVYLIPTTLGLLLLIRSWF